MEQHCDLIVRRDAIVLFAMLQTQPGVRLAGQPVTKLPPNAGTEDIGRAVLASLAAFQTGPHPTPAQAKAREVDGLRGTGFASWKALSKGAHRLGVKSDGKVVEITPSISDDRGGSMSLENDTVRAGLFPKEIGEAVLKAIGLCRHKSKLP